MAQPVYLNIFWHQHQPWYMRPNSTVGIMPWVRMHGIKDYYDIADLSNRFDGWKQSINLVPSLIEQLNGYCDGTLTDQSLILSRKAASELTHDEQCEVLARFFDAHAPRMIHPFPRYDELLRKRGHDINAAVERFTHQDILDLQVWFNLAWIDPTWRDDPAYPLHELINKKRDYSEEEKHALLDFQIDILRKIVPLHASLANEGKIELTTTPYFHPILPILCDSDIAKLSNPNDPVPHPPFQHPEDARWHLENGITYFEEQFGFRPNGMWPSEGSVSDQACGLIREQGINWFATDEEILFRSQPVSGSWKREDLYALHRLETNAGEIDCVFRDHGLSDLIGFVFQDRDPRQAASEFIGHLKNIGRHWSGDRPPLISVILDGENCWEFYPRDGHDFLRYWIEGILNDPQIIPTTVPEYRELHPPEPDIRSIFPGSWISHNYRIWIGHPEDNAAWSMIREARKKLIEAEARLDEKTREAAWRQLYICEGSDWFWWYGDENSSALDALFDELFRTHLAYMYELIDVPAPDDLSSGLKGPETASKMDGIWFVAPEMDSRKSGYYSWIGAKHLPAGGGGGAMHSATALKADLWYGRTQNQLGIRIHSSQAGRLDDSMKIRLRVTKPNEEWIDLVSASGRDTILRDDTHIQALLDLDSRLIQPEDEVWFRIEFEEANGSPFSIPHGNDLYLGAWNQQSADLLWFE